MFYEWQEAFSLVGYMICDFIICLQLTYKVESQYHFGAFCNIELILTENVNILLFHMLIFKELWVI